ncbi:MAG: polysaccharide deacetylase [Acidimicrobiia bacterium]|nr:polysaccharide deacetylase [Acidimicrobiia bacterium]
MSDDPLDRIPYQPATERVALEWPGGAGVACWVAANVEHREIVPLPDARRDPWPRMAHPDVRTYSHHDYGNRIGFWRMLEAFDRHDVPCTVSCNLAVLELFPEIRDAIVERDWEVMSHGLYNTRYLYGLDERDEAALLRECDELAQRLTGRRLLGMLGPSISASPRTPDLLARAGYLYHADWVHDDQPTPIRVREGRLVSVPYTYELNDAVLLRDHFELDELLARVRTQLAVLLDEAERDGAGRVLCVAVHPCFVGQPQRAGVFEEILALLAGTEGAWCTTAGEIARVYIDTAHDVALALGDAR